MSPWKEVKLDSETVGAMEQYLEGAEDTRKYMDSLGCNRDRGFVQRVWHRQPDTHVFQVQCDGILVWMEASGIPPYTVNYYMQNPVLDSKWECF